MTEPSHLIDSGAAESIRQACLNLLVRERLMAVLNAKNGVVTKINDRFLETTDKPMNEIIGKRLEQLWRLPSQIVDGMLDEARAGRFVEQVNAIVDSGGVSDGCASTVDRYRRRPRSRPSSCSPRTTSPRTGVSSPRCGARPPPSTGDRR